MSEILGTRNLAAKGGADGWRVKYLVQCEDGRQVVVEAAYSSALNSFKSKEVRAYVADNGRARALEETDKNEPGITHIRLWVDAVNGRIRVDPR